MGETQDRPFQLSFNSSLKVASNREGNCLAAKLRLGNVHALTTWEELLLPEIERQRAQGKEVFANQNSLGASLNQEGNSGLVR